MASEWHSHRNQSSGIHISRKEIGIKLWLFYKYHIVVWGTGCVTGLRFITEIWDCIRHPTVVTLNMPRKKIRFSHMCYKTERPSKRTGTTLALTLLVMDNMFNGFFSFEYYNKLYSIILVLSSFWTQQSDEVRCYFVFTIVHKKDN